jgi:hypothetical protein
MTPLEELQLLANKIKRAYFRRARDHLASLKNLQLTLVDDNLPKAQRTRGLASVRKLDRSCCCSLREYAYKLEALKACLASRKQPRKTASLEESSSLPRVRERVSVSDEVG